MQQIGSRSKPSVLNLIIIVVVILVVVSYTMISLATGDFFWFNPKFSETPNALVVNCYGENISIDPGSYNFSGLTKVINDSLSGKKRWDSLSLSEATYQDYQTHPSMMTVELIYNDPIRVHSSYKFFSNVTNIVIPLEGRHASTNAVFGLNQGVPAAGSLHIENKEPIGGYLTNMEICTYKRSSN